MGGRPLASQEIAAGHALTKHLSEFADLGITTEQQFAKHVERVLTNPSSVRYARDGRAFYLDENSGSVVIRNPSAEGTAFRPSASGQVCSNYTSKLPNHAAPYSRSWVDEDDEFKK